MTTLIHAAESGEIARTIGAVPLRIGLLGFGRVGQAVASLVSRARPQLIDAGIAPRCVAALVRDRRKPRPDAACAVTTEPDEWFRQDHDVIVEAMGGVEPARTLVTRAIERGTPVVTANKSLLAAHGVELRDLAARRGVPFLFDAAVLAGVPFLGSISRRPLVGGISRVSGILNGTSHFVVGEMASGLRFEDALAEAQRRGYAEPDSRADVSGRDAAEKLTVILQLAGVAVSTDTIPRQGIDTLTPDDLAVARVFGGTIKPVVLASIDAPGAGAWVGPAFVPDAHSFAPLKGVTNIVELARPDGHAVTFAGPGAGPEVTALTIVDDIVEAAASIGGRQRRPRCTACVRTASLSQPPEAGWLIRLRGTSSWRAAAIERRLEASHVATLRVFSRGDGWYVRIAPAPWTQVQYAATALRARGADVTLFPVVS